MDVGLCFGVHVSTSVSGYKSRLAMMEALGRLLKNRVDHITFSNVTIWT